MDRTEVLCICHIFTFLVTIQYSYLNFKVIRDCSTTCGSLRSENPEMLIDPAASYRIFQHITLRLYLLVLSFPFCFSLTRRLSYICPESVHYIYHSEPCYPSGQLKNNTIGWSCGKCEDLGFFLAATIVPPC